MLAQVRPTTRNRYERPLRLLPALFATTLGLCQATPTLAQIIITTDTVIDFQVGDMIYVQAPAKGPSPLVYFLEGADSFSLQTYDESTVLMTAGVSLLELWTYGSSMVIM